VKRLAEWGGVALVMLAVTACTPWPETYFKRAINQATQDVVTKELGPTPLPGSNHWRSRVELRIP
jgi:hypothetical protein